MNRHTNRMTLAGIKIAIQLLLAVAGLISNHTVTNQAEALQREKHMRRIEQSQKKSFTPHSSAVDREVVRASR